MHGMYDAGVIDKKTMRQFDEGCLTPVHAFSATEVKALCEHEEVSLTVFALYMNVSKDSVSQWERGIKKPAGPTLKLLSLVKQKGRLYHDSFLMIERVTITDACAMQQKS